MKKLPILTVIGLVFGIAAAEITARIIDLPPELYKLQLNSTGSVFKVSDNHILGFEFKKNYRDENADMITSYHYTNSHGLRDVERSIEKTGPRVILLGDSVVAGHGLPNLNYTISRQLEAMLNAGGYNWEVLNFGISGYTTLQEVELLKERGLQFSPDIVILFFLTNDNPVENTLVSLYGPEDINFFLRSIFLHSRLFRHILIRFNLFDVRFKTDSAYRQAVNDAHSDYITGAVAELEKLSREHNFDLYVVDFPRFHNSYNISYVEQKWKNDLIFVQMTAFLEKRGIPMIDVIDYYLRDYNQSPRTLHVSDRYSVNDSIHANRFGGSIAAQALLDELTRLYYGNGERR
ncbi:MAG: SGNH/GDSL hydrolase family protein [archaeon]